MENNEKINDNLKSIEINDYLKRIIEGGDNIDPRVSREELEKLYNELISQGKISKGFGMSDSEGLIDKYPKASPSPIEKNPKISPSPIEKYPKISPSPIEKYPKASPSPIEKYPKISPSPIEKYPKISPSPIEKYPKAPIDSRTNVGRGMGFKSIDGKEWETYEDAMSYNEKLYDYLFPKKIDKDSDKGMHR